MEEGVAFCIAGVAFFLGVMQSARRALQSGGVLHLVFMGWGRDVFYP